MKILTPFGIVLDTQVVTLRRSELLALPPAADFLRASAQADGDSSDTPAMTAREVSALIERRLREVERETVRAYRIMLEGGRR